MSSTGSENSALAFVAILLLIVVLRIRRIINGTRISKARSIVFSLYYVGFAALLTATSFLNGVSEDYVVLYVAVGAAGFFAAYQAVNRRLTFWRGPDNSIYAKGGIIIYLIYVVALIARVAIDVIYVPSALTFTFVSSSSVSSTTVLAEIVTDVLVAFGAGLLTARNVRLYQRYVGIEQGKETIPESMPA